MFQAAVATEPSTTTPSAAWLIVMPMVERGMVRNFWRRARPRNSKRLPRISHRPKPKAMAANVARPSIAMAAMIAAVIDAKKAIRSRASAGQSSARFQPRNGPTHRAANSGAQIGTKVALKNGGPTETFSPVTRSRNSG